MTNSGPWPGETPEAVENCSRCGRRFDEHPHAYGAKCVIRNPHAFRSQPMRGRFLWPDGQFESWTKPAAVPR